MIKKIAVSVSLAVFLLTASGCGSIRNLDTGKRSYLEQELISASIRGVLSQLDLSALRGRTVYLDYGQIADEGGTALDGGRIDLDYMFSLGGVVSPKKTTTHQYRPYTQNTSVATLNNIVTNSDTTATGTGSATTNTTGSSTSSSSGTNASSTNTNTTGSSTGTNTSNTTGTNSNTTNIGSSTDVTTTAANTSSSSTTDIGGTSSSTNINSSTTPSTNTSSGTNNTTTTTGTVVTSQNGTTSDTVNVGGTSGTSSGTTTTTPSQNETSGSSNSSSTVTTQNGASQNTSSGSSSSTTNGSNSSTSSGTAATTQSGTSSSNSTGNSTSTANTNSTSSDTSNTQSASNSNGTETVTTETLNESPVKSETQEKGQRKEWAIGSRKRGLGNFQRMQVPVSDNNFFLHLFKINLLRNGIHVNNSPKKADVHLVLNVYVFGMDRRRTDWTVHNVEKMEAKTTIEVMAFDNSKKMIMQPQEVSYLSTYQESYMFWVGPYSTQKFGMEKSGFSGFPIKKGKSDL